MEQLLCSKLTRNSPFYCFLVRWGIVCAGVAICPISRCFQHVPQLAGGNSTDCVLVYRRNEKAGNHQHFRGAFGGTGGLLDYDGVQC
ncbi:hypothetical protein WJX75_006487 [Coccomyxa subellipsoidea]|uniref:Secreted protein n=1 Tax=Coccomyxa subellipsoidea TaxID=248742 RepID=A0ABR2Z195_9CHLO